MDPGSIQSTNNTAIAAAHEVAPDSGVGSPATPNNLFSGVGNTAATAGTLYSIAQGLRTGGVRGDLQAGLGVGQLGVRGNMFGSATPGVGYGLGAAGGVLGLYNGIKEGGVQGYGGAVVGGLRAASGVEGLLGNAGAAGTLGTAAGLVAAPLTLYSAIKGWRSGDTAGDTLRGAEAGFAVGGPIGAGVGALVGAASSALGGGKTSQEQTMDRSIDAQLQGANPQQRAQVIASMSPSQSVQMINGYMNAANNSAGHSEAIEQIFGKNGVNNMLGEMMPTINAAIAKNPALKNASAADLYSQVVAPWLKSKGATINPNQRDVKGNPEGQNLIDALTQTINLWQNGQFTSSSQVGNGGETVNIPAYG